MKAACGGRRQGVVDGRLVCGRRGQARAFAHAKSGFWAYVHFNDPILWSWMEVWDQGGLDERAGAVVSGWGDKTIGDGFLHRTRRQGSELGEDSRVRGWRLKSEELWRRLDNSDNRNVGWRTWDDMCHFDSGAVASAASSVSSMPVRILLRIPLIWRKAFLSRVRWTGLWGRKGLADRNHWFLCKPKETGH